MAFEASSAGDEAEPRGAVHVPHAANHDCRRYQLDDWFHRNIVAWLAEGRRNASGYGYYISKMRKRLASARRAPRPLPMMGRMKPASKSCNCRDGNGTRRVREARSRPSGLSVRQQTDSTYRRLTGRPTEHLVAYQWRAG